MKSLLEQAAKLLKNSRFPVISTGAGMSQESGIPTFRDAPNSLWGNFNPEKLASKNGFLNNPPLVWRWYLERQRMIAQAEPNPGHIAVARLEKMFDSFVLITQNIDDLHRKAGSKNIVELHGNIFRYKCFDNEHPVLELPDDNNVPPMCRCGSLIRPDVVWFGEPLPEYAVTQAFAAISKCDTILVIGTSGTVYPAASFPSLAHEKGAAVIEINPQDSLSSRGADIFLKGPAAQLLPRLLEEMDIESI